MELADHRLDYLDYEGPVSDGRGSVTRWDRGTYRGEASGETEVVLVLSEGRLPCRLRLQQQGNHLWHVSFDRH